MGCVMRAAQQSNGSLSQGRKSSLAQNQRVMQGRSFARIISAFAVVAIAALLCAGASVQAFADDVADADFYAVLHADGSLVFQKEQPIANSENDASSGISIFEGDLDGYASEENIPWLKEASNIISVMFADDFKSLQPMSLQYWFIGCANMQSIDLTNLDASKSTTMRQMFKGCSSLSEIRGLEHFDTSSSTYFGSMFRDCSSLKSLDVSHFDASKVEVLCFMFNGCSNLETLNMSGEGWNTSSLHLMVHVWEGCSSLRSLDLSRLNTSSVTSMTCDFRGCTKLEYLNLSGVNTSSVGNLKYIFDGCDALSTVVLGEGFSFNGSSDNRQCSFPEGNWKSSTTGLMYTAGEVPNNVAATYTKVAASDTDSGSEDANEGSDDGSQNDKGDIQRGLKKGSIAKYAGATYKVTNNAKATVAFQKAPKSRKSVTVPAAVSLNGKKYAVTSIANGAFAKSKVKTVVVKTKKLAKKSVTGCFRGAKHLKTVKVPKAKRQAYIRIFKKSNSGLQVVVK